MSGFGKKGKENKGSSKKLQKLSEKELKATSISNHIKGNLDEAEKGYAAFIKNGFYDADIFSNYALICEGKGDIDKAIKLYEKCTSNFPNHLFSKINLSFLYYKFNNIKKAETLINEVIKLKPDIPNGHNIKGLILKDLNKYIESKISFEKAIELDSTYLDSYINLGLLNKDYNNYSDAEKYYLKALDIDKNSAIVHLNLGACYKEKLDLNKAILHTKIAINLNPKLENSYLNLATIYDLKGDYSESLRLAQKEIKINKNNELSYQLISDLAKKIDIKMLSGIENRELLKQLLNRKDISHREIFGTINNIFPNPVLKKLSLLENDLFENKEFNLLIKDQELVKSLSLLIFCSPRWEKVLAKIRKLILMRYTEKRQINKNIFNFIIALGSQCFLNEYVYYISEEEMQKLEELKETIHKNKKDQDYNLSLISCYQSLFSINNEIINLDNYISNNKEFNKLLDLQFKEIVIERNI